VYVETEATAIDARILIISPVDHMSVKNRIIII
jgi:hypothetical protein